MDVKYNDLVDSLVNKSVYMILGNGKADQYRDPDVVCQVLSIELETIPMGSAFLYFGNTAEVNRPDLGVLFEFMSKQRPDLEIHLIDIEERSGATPQFVTSKFYHIDYTEEYRYGGIDWNDAPQSNTKQWVSVHNDLGKRQGRKGLGIRRVFMFGGDDLAMDSARMAARLNIPVKYHAVERLFLGDGKTPVTDTTPRNSRIGPSHIMEMM